jgi:hypothetical protein
MECHGVPMDFQTRSSKLIYLTMLLAFFHPFPFAPLPGFRGKGIATFNKLVSWTSRVQPISGLVVTNFSQFL